MRPLKIARTILVGDSDEGAGYCYAGMIIILAAYGLLVVTETAYGDPATISADAKGSYCLLRPSVLYEVTKGWAGVSLIGEPTALMAKENGHSVLLCWRAPAGARKPRHLLSCEADLWPVCQLGGTLYLMRSATGGWTMGLDVRGQRRQARLLFNHLGFAIQNNVGFSLEVLRGELKRKPSQLGALIYDPERLSPHYFPSPERWPVGQMRLRF